VHVCVCVCMCVRACMRACVSVLTQNFMPVRLAAHVPPTQKAQSVKLGAPQNKTNSQRVEGQREEAHEVVRNELIVRSDLKPYIVEFLFRKEHVPRQERGSAQQGKDNVHNAVAVLNLFPSHAASVCIKLCLKKMSNRELSQPSGTFIYYIN